MKSFKNVLAIALFLMGATLFAQSKLTGKVVDENNMPLPGASVVIKGTTKGTVTDFDGKFNLECKNPNGTVEVSYVGYEPTNIAYNGSKDFGSVQLQPSADTLDEVVIVGVADIAKERETPVAVSTIKATEIVEKLGSKELPEILNATPSVYATKAGGGFGDSRINIRGFDQKNTAIMINGVAVNDMENGWVYYSNWAGLSDVLSFIQVQRGLGSSKLGIPSVGGTVNYMTRTSDIKEGGSVAFTYRGEESVKGSVSYSTGLLESGLSASLLFAQDQGSKYADGTNYKGNTYFIGVGYKINDNQNLMFTATGAPQWHNQKYGMPISTFLRHSDNEDPNIKYNNNWGYLNGEEYNWSQNFYHKPIASLNWDWNLNETADLATVIYGSWGRGGGTGSTGKINTLGTYDTAGASNLYNDGLIRFDDIVLWNKGQTVADFGATRTGVAPFYNKYNLGMTRISSMNSHDWYGALSNFHKNFDKIGFDLGVDLRTYKAYHYKVVNDLIGANGFINTLDLQNPNQLVTETYSALPAWNPFTSIKDQVKTDRNYNGLVNWLSAFTQVEYKSETVSAFIQGGVSQQNFKREEFYRYTKDSITDWTKMLGGNIKGGINYNINKKHNVFGNAGYYSKQPNFNAVYIGGNSDPNKVRENLKNETIIGVELGYAFRSASAGFNLNLYRTEWNDRFQRSGNFTLNNVLTYTDFNGVNELHQGVELESYYKPIDNLKLLAMFSIGDWYYKGNAEGTNYDATTNAVIGTSDNKLYLDKVKVGDAAQFTSRLGLEWKAFKNFRLDLSQQFYNKLYAPLNISNFTTEGKQTLLLPSYSLTDMGMSYKFVFTDKLGLTFRFNVDNLFDQIYISEASSSSQYLVTDATTATWNGIDTRNSVNFGWGRTWSASVRFDF